MNRLFRSRWIAYSKTALGWLGLVLFSFTGITGIANGEIPRQLSYYGFLSDPSGKPIVGSQTITFRLYDDPASGNRLWEETHQVNLNKGLFQVLLGEKENLDVTFDRPLWMTLEVNREGEMTPRLPLVSVGYALNAAALDSVPASYFLRADRGGKIQGALSVEGTLLVQGKPAMIWDRRSIIMVGLVSFACGALGGVLVFTLARILTHGKR